MEPAPQALLTAIAWPPVTRGMTRGRALASAIVVAAIVATAAPGTAGGVAPGAARLATPVLSVRRAPAWIAASVATARLDRSLSAILANPTLHAPGASNCLLVTQEGRTLFSHDPATELLPASNLKLFGATAVLDKLGPTARITTPVVAARLPVAGVLSGDLYLVGSGDPGLRTPDFLASLEYPEPVDTPLGQLAAQVRAAGVTRITGSVVADESRYDALRGVPTWKPSYLADGTVGPLSAADVDDGFATFGAGGGGVGSPAPATEAAARLTAALRAVGVSVSGRPATGVAPPGAMVVTSIASPPLADVLGAVLRESDDTGAELLTKELGLRFAGAGTTAAGVGVIRADLASLGLPIDQLVAADGSGLDRSDRATCALVVATVAHAGPQSPLASVLPVAGLTGTLIHRMSGTLAAGRVAAKTGTLDDVSALSGFVYPAGSRPPAPDAPPPPPPAGAPLVFSIISDGVPSAVGARIDDQIAVALAAYPSGPAPFTLGPLPAGGP